MFSKQKVPTSVLGRGMSRSMSRGPVLGPVKLQCYVTWWVSPEEEQPMPVGASVASIVPNGLIIRHSRRQIHIIVLWTSNWAAQSNTNPPHTDAEGPVWAALWVNTACGMFLWVREYFPFLSSCNCMHWLAGAGQVMGTCSITRYSGFKPPNYQPSGWQAQWH